MSPARNVAAREEWAALLAEHADRHSVVLDEPEKGRPCARIVEKPVRRTVIVAGIVAGAELDRLAAERHELGPAASRAGARDTTQ